MTALPQTTAQLIAEYGPHLHDTPPGGWHGRGTPDRLVKTHCCFCGVQCGIQLKVKDDKVIGFEPWEDFPLNRGMLCPKGVKRYLQGSHPDRLLTPLIRTPDGFRAADWPSGTIATWMDQTSTPPNTVARFTFGLHGTQVGSFDEAFNLLSNSIRWFDHDALGGFHLPIIVTKIPE